MEDEHGNTLDIAAIEQRIEARRQQDAAAARARAGNHPDNEPAGKLTQPTDTCRQRDRRGDD